MVLSSVALFSAGTSVVVGLIALGLALLAFRARRRTGNPRLVFVGMAFLVVVGKSLLSAWDVSTPFPHPVPHDSLEAVLSLFDLVTIALLAAPLLIRRPAP